MREYIAWFNAKAIQVENLNNKTECEALTKGMKNVKFLDSLIKNLAVTLKFLSNYFMCNI